MRPRLARAPRTAQPARVPFPNPLLDETGLAATATGTDAVRLTLEAADRLGPAAARRGVPVEVLARRILHIIARDGLVDAVLDDGMGA